MSRLLHHLGALCLAGLLPLVLGCYDSVAMLEQVRKVAIKKRLEEIDLGEYRVTLPKRHDTGEVVEIALHVVGQLPHYKLKQIEHLLEEKRVLIRDATITAIRAAQPAELAEPSLAQLKGRLLILTNEALGEQLINDVVLSEFGFSRG